MEIVQEYVSDAKNFLIEEDDLKFNYDREQAMAEEMRKIGVQEGEQKKMTEIVKSLFKNNVSIDTIAKSTNLSIIEIENILKAN